MFLSYAIEWFAKARKINRCSLSQTRDGIIHSQFVSICSDELAHAYLPSHSNPQCRWHFDIIKFLLALNSIVLQVTALDLCKVRVGLRFG